MSEVLPPEPSEGSAVRDCDGVIWAREGDLWYRASSGNFGAMQWSNVNRLRGPVTLMSDGPVLS